MNPKYAPYRQMEKLDLYRKYAQELIDKGILEENIFACYDKIRKRKSIRIFILMPLLVWVERFELSASNSRSWRANRTALHPEIATANIRKIILNYQIILGLMSKKITLRP